MSMICAAAMAHQVEAGSDAVKGDFNALSLLEYHLVSNSAKFTEKGQVRAQASSS